MEYRIHKDSEWVETSELCERDGKKVYVEVLKDGTKTDHYCCERDGCTEQQYRHNVKFINNRLDTLRKQIK